MWFLIHLTLRGWKLEFNFSFQLLAEYLALKIQDISNVDEFILLNQCLKGLKVLAGG